MKSTTSNRKIIAYLLILSVGLILLVISNINGYAKSIEKGWLGVGISELTPSLRRDAGLDDKDGLLVTTVYDESPAEEAGIKDKDIILSYNGKSIRFAEDLIDLVQNTEPGTKVKIELFRDGKTMTVKAKITEKDQHEQDYSNVVKKKIKISLGHPVLGINVQDIDQNLAEYFHVDEHKGVLITKVLENSPAEKAGLQSGDVIVKFGDEAIHYTDDIQYALKEYNDGDKVAIKIIRKFKPETVEITLKSKEPIEFQIQKHSPCSLHDFDFDRFDNMDMRIDIEDHDIDIDQIIDNMNDSLKKLFKDIGI